MMIIFLVGERNIWEMLIQHAYNGAPWSNRCHLCSLQGSWTVRILWLWQKIIVLILCSLAPLEFMKIKWFGSRLTWWMPGTEKERFFFLEKYLEIAHQGHIWLCNCPESLGRHMYFSWAFGVSKEILHMSNSLYFTPLCTLILEIQEFSASGQSLSWVGNSTVH